MKWMIASDLHGSAYYTKELLKAMEREAPDRLLLLGDLLYHGPRNDLPLAEKLLCVRGNCEAEVDQMVLDFPVMADYCVLPAGKHLIYATHGHVFTETKPPKLCVGDILLTGHTHVPKCVHYETYHYLNPGAVSIPKEGSWHGYMTWEGETFLWKDLAGAEQLRWEMP